MLLNKHNQKDPNGHNYPLSSTPAAACNQTHISEAHSHQNGETTVTNNNVWKVIVENIKDKGFNGEDTQARSRECSQCHPLLHFRQHHLWYLLHWSMTSSTSSFTTTIVASSPLMPPHFHWHQNQRPPSSQTPPTPSQSPQHHKNTESQHYKSEH